MLYNIPAARFQWFKEQVEELVRKSKKILNESSIFTVIGYHIEEDKSSPHYDQKIMEIIVEVEEPVLEGWRLVAILDHTPEGNIIRKTGDWEIPRKYREVDSHCDHCSTNRRRRDTYLLEHEDGDFKQVGSSCLKDFLGHVSVDDLVRRAQLLTRIHNIATYSGPVNHRWIDVEGYLQHVAQSIEDHGWRRRSEGESSTAIRAFNSYKEGRMVSTTAKEQAKHALEWAGGCENGDDYEHACWVISNMWGLEERSLGIAASMVRGMFSSSWIGEVGERVKLEVDIVEARPSRYSYLIKARTKGGDLVSWFSPQPLNGSQKIVGTIKQHVEYGVKITNLHRVN